MPLNKMPKQSTVMSILPAVTAISTINTSPIRSKSMPEMQESIGVVQPIVHTQVKKWTCMLDFEKIFKQMHHLDEVQHKSTNNTIYTNNNHANLSSSAKMKTKVGEVRQVQRLDDTEMHFYVTAPKQTSKELIICDVCTGIFNKPGFSDHIFTQHPTKWTKISTLNSELSFAYNENSHDGIRNDVYNTNAEILGSPSDLSGTMSTCSNASSGSTSTTSSGTNNYISTLISGPTQKRSSKTGSSSESSTSSSWRSRNKSKHHSSFSKRSTNTNAELLHSTSAATSSFKKRSTKKSQSYDDNDTNVNTIKSMPSSLISINKEVIETKKKPKLRTAVVDALVVNNVVSTKAPTVSKKGLSDNSTHSLYTSSSSLLLSSSSSSSSTSSNSSYSIPPKMQPNPVASEAVDAGAREVSHSIEPLYSSINNSMGNKMTELYSNIKKKNKNSGNYESLENGSQCNATDGLVLVQQTLAINERPKLSQYQITELDQAVSSITDLKDDSGTRNNSVENITGSEEVSQTCNVDDGQAVNNGSDNSVMLRHVLDEMLDSNFINEILNAESDINFDVHELNESVANQMANSAFVEEPPIKRMRFDNDILNTETQQKLQNTPQTREITHDYNGEYGIFPPPTSQHQQQLSYNQCEATTMPLGNQYHQSTSNTIDAMQLQQLLFQQQQQSQHHSQNQLEAAVYSDVNMDTLNISNLSQQQSQQHAQSHLYNTNGTLVDTTKQIIELCGTVVNNTINSNDMPTEYAQDEYMGVQDMSAQFQLYNVPSLTDGSMDVQEINPTTHHIVERQYVVPPNEEQLIYEFTSNNSVVVLSQQHEQVITEFLNQAATYEQQQQSQQQPFHINNSTEEAFNCPKSSSIYCDDLFNFDYSLIETVKSISNTTNPNGDFVASKKINSQQQTFSAYAYHEDFYYNVFHYAGIPRPLAINSFGLIKLPQGVASTMRKYLLTTRKLSNSLITLGGSNGLNGIVGQSSTVASAASVSARINNSKQLPNYFTSLAGANEFSIGSITITNSTANNNLTQSCGNNPVHKQQSQGINSCYQDSNINSTSNGVATTSRSGHKSSRSSANYSGVVHNIISNNSKHKFSSGQCFSTTVQVNVGTIGLQNTKTIIVSSAAALSAERNIRVIKRNLIAKIDASKPQQSNGPFQIKNLAEIIAGKKACVINNNTINCDNTVTETVTDGQLKVQSFYERRRKLLSTSQKKQNSLHVAPYQTKQLVIIPSQHCRQNYKRHSTNHSVDHFNGHMAASLTNSSDVNVTRVFM